LNRPRGGVTIGFEKVNSTSPRILNFENLTVGGIGGEAEVRPCAFAKRY
jgi:hypothetical protein